MEHRSSDVGLGEIMAGDFISFLLWEKGNKDSPWYLESPWKPQKSPTQSADMVLPVVQITHSSPSTLDIGWKSSWPSGDINEQGAYSDLLFSFF